MAELDTIYALSSAPGRGAVAIIRVSGSKAHNSLFNLSQQKSPPNPRQTVLRSIYDVNGKPIDNALVVIFAAPFSFTGEDIVEYHVHGGMSVVQTLLQNLSLQDNHRMALPGEFTRRAFENGKLDLTEAEAIADLVDAETESQRLQALDQLSGSLETLYESWKNDLAHLLALMEADLDFSDQDLPDDILLKVKPDLSHLISAIESHLDDNRRGERLRQGFQIAILGAPNAGKSSLLNVLTKRNAAIVSPMAGTTRDVIETHLDIGGYPVVLSDTAGLRSDLIPDNEQALIEAEGISRAIEKAQEADIKILLFDATIEPDGETLALADERSIIVLNKTDLKSSGQAGVEISALNGSGIDNLLQQIVQQIEKILGNRNTPALTRARHREALIKTRDCLYRSTHASMPELVTEDLRLAIRHLGSITGRVDIEDLLDMIFRDFCIGK